MARSSEPSLELRDEVEACGEGIHMLTLQEDLPIVIEDKRDVLLIGAIVPEGSILDKSRLRIKAEAIVVHLSLLVYLLDIYDLLSLAGREVVAVDD